MKIYSTLSAQKEELVTIEPNVVKMYVCGPTVYDKGHLGHGRSMVAFDLVRRYLLYKGYEVDFVVNYTDIDDKMIKRAEEEGISVEELADKIIPMYDRDFGTLNILKPTNSPRATQYIKEMMEMVKVLLEDGYAYELDDGVYFDVSKFDEYGKLSKQDIDELQHGARVEVKKGKKNPSDFVLWKFKKEGEPSWIDNDEILKEGRPGWHIECSVMSRELLGDTFDIHAGGLDLVFPHHDCEIAQSESANEKKFANYWMHNGYVNIEGEKMSKSLNNFQTLEDTFASYDPRVVRYFLLSTHYRMPIDFSENLLKQANASLDRIQTFYDRVRSCETEGEEISIMHILEDAVNEFEEAMDDDFEISAGLGAVFTMIKKLNSIMDERKLSSIDRDTILSVLDKFDRVLGVIDHDEKNLDKELLELIKEREEARAQKKFKEADKLRDKLLKKGVQIEDTDEGTKWKIV